MAEALSLPSGWLWKGPSPPAIPPGTADGDCGGASSLRPLALLLPHCLLGRPSDLQATHLQGPRDEFLLWDCSCWDILMMLVAF